MMHYFDLVRYKLCFFYSRILIRCRDAHVAISLKGRLDQLLYVSLPSLDDRESIIRVISKHIPLDVDVDIKSLAARTDAFTGADLELLFRESAVLALREDIGIQRVSYKHVEPVLLRMKETVVERISTNEGILARQ